MIVSLRIVLDGPSNTPVYWACDAEGDLTDALPAEQALQCLRDGVPFVVAIADPDCKHSHYESIETSLLRI